MQHCVRFLWLSLASYAAHKKAYKLTEQNSISMHGAPIFIRCGVQQKHQHGKITFCVLRPLLFEFHKVVKLLANGTKTLRFSRFWVCGGAIRLQSGAYVSHYIGNKS